MAVTEIKKPMGWQRDYFGLSTDVKPTNVPIGSTFKETDTATPFVTYDGTNWVQDVGGKVGHNVTGLTSTRKVVATAGTPERLVAASTPCKYVILTAIATNTGRVMYGNSAVDETPATAKGNPLYVVSGIPQTHMIPCDDAYDIYLDSAVNLEGVVFNILT